MASPSTPAAISGMKRKNVEEGDFYQKKVAVEEQPLQRCGAFVFRQEDPQSLQYFTSCSVNDEVKIFKNGNATQKEYIDSMKNIDQGNFDDDEELKTVMLNVVPHDQVALDTTLHGPNNEVLYKNERYLPLNPKDSIKMEMRVYDALNTEVCFESKVTNLSRFLDENFLQDEAIVKLLNESPSSSSSSLVKSEIQVSHYDEATLCQGPVIYRMVKRYPNTIFMKECEDKLNAYYNTKTDEDGKEKAMATKEEEKIIEDYHQEEVEDDEDKIMTPYFHQHYQQYYAPQRRMVVKDYYAVKDNDGKTVYVRLQNTENGVKSQKYSLEQVQFDQLITNNATFRETFKQIQLKKLVNKLENFDEERYNGGGVVGSYTNANPILEPCELLKVYKKICNHDFNNINIVLVGPPGVGKGTLVQDIKKDFESYGVDGLVTLPTNVTNDPEKYDSCRTIELNTFGAGDILRDEIKNETPLGLRIKTRLDAGELVKNETINAMMETNIVKTFFDSKVKTDEDGNFKSFNFNMNVNVIDGYPRSVEQAKYLQEEILKNHGSKVDIIVGFDINDDDCKILEERCLKRKIHKDTGKIYFADDEAKAEANGALKPSEENSDWISRKDDTVAAFKKRIDAYKVYGPEILNYYATDKSYNNSRFMMIPFGQNGPQMRLDVHNRVKKVINDVFLEKMGKIEKLIADRS